MFSQTQVSSWRVVDLALFLELDHTRGDGSLDLVPLVLRDNFPYMPQHLSAPEYGDPGDL